MFKPGDLIVVADDFSIEFRRNYGFGLVISIDIEKNVANESMISILWSGSYAYMGRISAMHPSNIRRVEHE